MAIEYVDSTQLDSDLTSVADAIRAKSGGSSQLAFPAGFVSEIQAIPSGGGGATKIASGTYTGAGTINVDIPVGKKMASQDFLLRLYAPDGTVFTYDTDYKIARFQADSSGVRYTLTSNADPCPVTALVYTKVNNNGSYTNIQNRGNWYVNHVRSAALSYGIQANTGYNRIKRDSSGFYIKVQNYNANFKFVNGLTYNWELYYYGSDPTNDIVEVT